MKTLCVALAVLAWLIPGVALATVQKPESIIIDGQKYFLHTLPLDAYHNQDHPLPPFQAPHTACWRGYVGTWEIDRGVLYLKAIRAWTLQGEVGLTALFPGHPGRVDATWFTGQLRVPQGKVLRVRMPYPIYEKDLIITVEKGRVIRQETIDNTGQVPPPRR